MGDITKFGLYFGVSNLAIFYLHVTVSLKVSYLKSKPNNFYVILRRNCHRNINPFLSDRIRPRYTLQGFYTTSMTIGFLTHQRSHRTLNTKIYCPSGLMSTRPPKKWREKDTSSSGGSIGPLKDKTKRVISFSRQNRREA